MKCIYLVIRLIIPFIKKLINAFNYLDFNATLKPSIKLKWNSNPQVKTNEIKIL
jgi:hypothetical protein